MITKITGETSFQVLTNNFSISPSNEGYTLQISADGTNFSNLFSVGANVTRLVTGVAANSYYRLLGNQSVVSINWMKTCVTEGGGASGTELQPVSEFPLDVPAGTVIAYSGSSSAAGVYQYDGTDWAPAGGEVDLSAYWTSAQTQSAITAVEDHLFDVEEVTASALTELHEGLLEVSGRTVDLSNYYTSAQTESAITMAVSGKANAANTEAHSNGFTFPEWNTQGIITGKTGDFYLKSITLNGDATNWLSYSNYIIQPKFYAPTTSGNPGEILVSTGNGAPVWSAMTFITSADTQDFVTSEDVEEIAEVTAGAINQLQGDVSEKTEFRKHVYVSLGSLASSIEFNQAFFDVDEDDEPVSQIAIFKAGELIDIGDMKTDAVYTISIEPSSQMFWYDAEENNGELIPAGFYSLAFSKGDEGENFTNETFRVAIGSSDAEDIEALNVTTTTGNTIREAIEKYNNDWALTRDRVFIVDQDGFPTEWFFKDDVRYFEIHFYEDGKGNWGYNVNIDYANTVHTKDDGFGLIKNIMKIEQSAYDALVNDGITDPETLYVVVPDSN